MTLDELTLLFHSDNGLIYFSSGEYAPAKPNLHVLGRNEIFVQWNAPERPLGRINFYEVTQDGEVCSFCFLYGQMEKFFFFEYEVLFVFP